MGQERLRALAARLSRLSAQLLVPVLHPVLVGHFSQRLERLSELVPLLERAEAYSLRLVPRLAVQHQTQSALA